MLYRTKIMRFIFITILITLFIFSIAARPRAGTRLLPSTCTYEMQVWNVNRKKSNGMRKVTHPYASLAPDERDPATGCTVCSEDQESITIPHLPKFSVCCQLAPRVRSLLEMAMKRGALIHTIEGYRVVKSRGGVDRAGNRTEFSNHSFGTAIDINPEQNGLYDNCITFGPDCHLLRGGRWRVGAPGTLEKDSDVVVLFEQEGFRWGGEIEGRQKDFMHFSLTGY
jgi:hypothetical protein